MPSRGCSCGLGALAAAVIVGVGWWFQCNWSKRDESSPELPSLDPSTKSQTTDNALNNLDSKVEAQQVVANSTSHPILLENDADEDPSPSGDILPLAINAKYQLYDDSDAANEITGPTSTSASTSPVTASPRSAADDNATSPAKAKSPSGATLININAYCTSPGVTAEISGESEGFKPLDSAQVLAKEAKSADVPGSAGDASLDASSTEEAKSADVPSSAGDASLDASSTEEAKSADVPSSAGDASLDASSTEEAKSADVSGSAGDASLDASSTEEAKSADVPSSAGDASLDASSTEEAKSADIPGSAGDASLDASSTEEAKSADVPSSAGDASSRHPGPSTEPSPRKNSPMKNSRSYRKPRSTPERQPQSLYQLFGDGDELVDNCRELFNRMSRLHSDMLSVHHHVVDALQVEQWYTREMGPNIDTLCEHYPNYASLFTRAVELWLESNGAVAHAVYVLATREVDPALASDAQLLGILTRSLMDMCDQWVWIENSRFLLAQQADQWKFANGYRLDVVCGAANALPRVLVVPYIGVYHDQRENRNDVLLRLLDNGLFNPIELQHLEQEVINAHAERELRAQIAAQVAAQQALEAEYARALAQAEREALEEAARRQQEEEKIQLNPEFYMDSSFLDE